MEEISFNVATELTTPPRSHLLIHGHDLLNGKKVNQLNDERGYDAVAGVTSFPLMLWCIQWKGQKKQMFADKLFNEIKFLLNSCHEQTPTFSPQENTPCRACVLKLLQIYTNQVVLLLLAWKRTRLMGPYICLQMPHKPRADSQRGLSSPSHSSARLIGRWLVKLLWGKSLSWLQFLPAPHQSVQVRCRAPPWSACRVLCDWLPPRFAPVLPWEVLTTLVSGTDWLCLCPPGSWWIPAPFWTFLKGKPTERTIFNHARNGEIIYLNYPKSQS